MPGLPVPHGDPSEPVGGPENPPRLDAKTLRTALCIFRTLEADAARLVAQLDQAVDDAVRLTGRVGALGPEIALLEADREMLTNQIIDLRSRIEDIEAELEGHSEPRKI